MKQVGVGVRGIGRELVLQIIGNHSDKVFDPECVELSGVGRLLCVFVFSCFSVCFFIVFIVML